MKSVEYQIEFISLNPRVNFVPLIEGRHNVYKSIDRAINDPVVSYIVNKNKTTNL